MDHQQNCAIAATLIDRMTGLLSEADLSTPVPTCPGWDLARLITHVGGIHRWAVQLVEARAQERVAPTKGERGDNLVAWLAAGALPVAGLVTADPNDRMWSWGKEQTVGFWSRRLLHETAVHYADAAIALGVEPQIEAPIAIDGIDESLGNLPFATWSPTVANLRGTDSIHLHGTDTEGAEWMIQMNDSGYTFDHSHGKGSVAVRGTAVDLYLLLQSRRSLDSDRFETFGDRAVIEFWLANAST
ncbi:MAG: maleylpyruvate isomerase family mycothiol-dependent enzyme [Actinomycetota bacterium]